MAENTAPSNRPSGNNPSDKHLAAAHPSSDAPSRQETGPVVTAAPDAKSVSRGYEVGDVPPKWVAYVLVGFLAFAIVCHFFLWFLWKFENRRAEKVDPPRSAVADSQPLNNAPQLQPSYRHDKYGQEDLADMYKDENRVLEAMGLKVKPTKLTTELPDDLIARVEARRTGAARPIETRPIETRPGGNSPATRPAAALSQPASAEGSTR